MLKDIDYSQNNPTQEHTNCVEDAFQMGLLDNFAVEGMLLDRKKIKEARKHNLKKAH